MGLLLSKWLSAGRSTWELLKRHGLRPIGGAAAGHVQVAPDSTGKDVDADSLTSSEGPTVYRQNVIISDPATYAAKAGLTNAQPLGTEYGLITRPAGPPADKSTLNQTLTMSSTANAVTLNVQGCGSASVYITYSGTGLISLEGTTDGTTWLTWLAAFNVSGQGYYYASLVGSGNSYFIGSVLAFSSVRIRCSTTGTLTATVSIEASAAAFSIPVDSLLLGSDATGGHVAMFTNSYGLAYNGATMDRLRTAAASGIGLGVLKVAPAAATAKTVLPTAVADAAVAAPLFDKWGRQAVTSIPLDLVTGAQINPTTAATTQVLAAGGAGVRYGIMHIHVSNAGAINQQVDIKDGSTVVWTTFAAASGGGAEADYSNTPILCTAATALNATTSAASSTFIRVDVAQLA